MIVKIMSPSSTYVKLICSLYLCQTVYLGPSALCKYYFLNDTSETFILNKVFQECFLSPFFISKKG